MFMIKYTIQGDQTSMFMIRYTIQGEQNIYVYD